RARWRARRSPRLALSLGRGRLRAHHQLRHRRRPRRGERRARRVSSHQPLARGYPPARRVADPGRLPRAGVAARRRGTLQLRHRRVVLAHLLPRRVYRHRRGARGLHPHRRRQLGAGRALPLPRHRRPADRPGAGGDGHPGFALYSFGTTDDVTVLVGERNLTAVNNALLVDLTGQVASEGIGTQLWSGVGGQAAFAIAAAYSPGGRAIFVLPSVHRTAEGLRSRIVPVLPPGTPVTLPRGFVDHVVTEHGIATLGGKTLRQRVGELLAIAHPDFRAELRAEARRVYCW